MVITKLVFECPTFQPRGCQRQVLHPVQFPNLFNAILFCPEGPHGCLQIRVRLFRHDKHLALKFLTRLLTTVAHLLGRLKSVKSVSQKCHCAIQTLAWHLKAGPKSSCAWGCGPWWFQSWHNICASLGTLSSEAWSYLTARLSGGSVGDPAYQE